MLPPPPLLSSPFFLLDIVDDENGDVPIDLNTNTDFNMSPVGIDCTIFVRQQHQVECFYLFFGFGVNLPPRAGKRAKCGFVTHESSVGLLPRLIRGSHQKGEKVEKLETSGPKLHFL